MSNLISKWNKNNFSIYKSEEKTVLELIESMNNFNKDVIKEIDNKTDNLGDHKGSWQGIEKPTQVQETIGAVIDKNVEDIQIIKTNSNKPMKIMLISDLHYEANLSYGVVTSERFDWIMQLIKEENAKSPIDLLVVNGDLASYDYSRVEYVKEMYLDKLNIPYIVTRGNHDYVPNGEFKNIFGYDENFSFELDDIFVICPYPFDDSTYSTSNASVVSYSDIDINFLENEIKKSKGKPVILLTHDFKEEMESAEVKQFIVDNVNAIIKGHTHKHRNLEFTYDNKTIPVFEIGLLRGKDYSVFTDDEYRYAYRILEVEGNALTTKVILPNYTYSNGTNTLVQEYQEINKVDILQLENRLANNIATIKPIKPQYNKVYDLGVGNSISEGDDLNSLLEVGVYNCLNGTIARTLLNNPMSTFELNTWNEYSNFKLIVENINNTAYPVRQQTIITGSSASPQIYKRNIIDGSTFTPWIRVADNNFIRQARFEITEGTDLNNCISTGKYMCANTTIKDSLTNVPSSTYVPYGFTLEVDYLGDLSNGWRMQKLYSYTTSRGYILYRTYSSSRWSNWFVINGTELT